MQKSTFEEYLREVHTQLYPMVLDDDLPDHFDKWISELDIEEIIKYAERYGSEQFNAGLKCANAVITTTRKELNKIFNKKINQTNGTDNT